MTQKFEELHLSITPINREKYHYLVRTEESPKGVLPAEKQVIFPVDEWLEQASRLMDDSVTGLLHGYGSLDSLDDDFLYGSHSETVPQDREKRSHGVSSLTDVAQVSRRTQIRTLVDLGREMYEALFQGDLRDRLTSAIAIAHNQGAVLRLRLGLKDSILPRLPWEVLHEDCRPIATGKDIIFSRYQPTLSSLILPPPPSRPLKVLMVIAAPTDQANLALKYEADILKKDLKKPAYNGAWGNTPLPEIELDILEHPDREKLTQVLEQNAYHVLHYAGHSNLGARGGELYLVNQKTGLGEVLNGDDLAGLLVNNGIHLAVFNSCRGAHSAADIPDESNPRSLAEVLVSRGIPAVLAMAERIPDRVALTLTSLFYHNLKQGYPVDLSLNRARQGLMSTYGSDRLYWALPVLYLHEKYQGYLTSQPTKERKNVFIPPVSPFNGRSRLGDTPQKMNNNSAALLWRNSHSEPDDLADDDADLADDESDYKSDYESDYESDCEDDLEDNFFRPSDEEFLADEDEVKGKKFSGRERDEFLDDELGYEDDDEDEFLDGELGDEADSDVKALISDIFSSLNSGASGSADLFPPKLTPEDELFPNIPGAETEVAQPKKPSPTKDLLNQTKARIASGKSAANLTRSGKNLPPSQLPELSADGLQKSAKSRKAFRWRFGVISFLAIALLAGAIGFWRSRPQSSTSLSSTAAPEVQGASHPETSSEKPSPLAKASTPDLAAIAIENFAQGKLPEGVIAVNLLLDRGALPQAKATLEAVPNSKKNSPEINFLAGRLAWQFVQTGNKDYSFSDARRFWEAAAKSDPNSTLYANALAFAYYAEGNLDLASDMWLKVVTLLEPTQSLDHPDALTAYAGLALVMMKSSDQLPPEEQHGLLSKAVKQRKMVMKLAASDFQPDSLAKNWLWPESAIADWQKLLTLNN